MLYKNYPRPPYGRCRKAGGSLFIALPLTMIACLILGMGLPTTATYIVLVTMAAPALLSLDHKARIAVGPEGNVMDGIKMIISNGR
jgi:TRAP-type uncharacterized transport system fused permease subunit